MSEFIGSRISLVSRSDIRYVGTLHEINSETSTVALENVSSFGTEGRKNNPDEEIPPSDSVYEYIVFRGSDVKDLRIEEAPAVKENKPPQVPNDPAILGSGSRPQNFQGQGAQNQQPPPQQQPGGPPQFQQYPPQFYPPPPGNWGRGGPPGPGFPGAPFGAPPPGWYPPPGQGFPQPPPGAFPYSQFPPGPPGQGFPQGPGSKPAPIGPGANKQQGPPAQQDAPKPADKAADAAPSPAAKAPTPPVESKPAAKEVEAAPQQPAAAKPPTGPKNGRIMPAIPLQSPAAQKTAPQSKAPAPAVPAPNPALDDATRAATAAVAAAMAKLPNQPNGSNNGVDNLTRKVAEMRTSEPIRAPRHPGNNTGFAAGQRGRGGRGGARPEQRKVEVPTTDFDFESANAKFNKQDLVKEAIAGSPLGETPSNGAEEASEPKDDVVIPAGSGYNKSTSFFDNISSESKDRAEANGNRPGGREWRGKEQALNVETFGQGSVDNGYRGGFRGRGRGRGGMRGRGYGNGQPRGRGGYRGGQTEVQ